jgi:hypothetical protein
MVRSVSHVSSYPSAHHDASYGPVGFAARTSCSVLLAATARFDVDDHRAVRDERVTLHDRAVTRRELRARSGERERGIDRGDPGSRFWFTSPLVGVTA